MTGHAKITVRVPATLRTDCERLVEEGHYENLSDLVRAGIRAELRRGFDVVERRERRRSR